MTTTTLSQAADHLRVVDSFRRRGVPSSAVHALLPNILREVRTAGFTVPFIDVPVVDGLDGSDAAAATVTLACEHFLLDVSFNAASDLGAAIGQLQLQHCSQAAPVWPHASIQQLENELQGRLRLGDAPGFCERLSALRRAQELLSLGKQPSRLFGSEPSDWTDADSTLNKLTGSVPESGCEGLRAIYYVPPGQVADVHRLVLRPLASSEAAAPGLCIELLPPLVVEAGVAGELRRLAAGTEAGAGADDAPERTASMQAWLTAGADGTDGVGVSSGAAEAEALVPVGPHAHRQRWSLTDSGQHGVELSTLRLGAAAKAPLGRLIAQLRTLACFARVWRSAWHEPLLQLPAGPTAPAGPGCDAYRVELQPRPPDTLCVLVPLPAVGRLPARLAQVRLRLEQQLESNSLAWVVDADAAGSAADAAPAAYAARLLNECHSLPLAVAFLVQQAAAGAGAK